MTFAAFHVAASQRMWALQRLRKLIATEFHRSLNVEAILGLEVTESAMAYNVRFLKISYTPPLPSPSHLPITSRFLEYCYFIYEFPIAFP